MATNPGYAFGAVTDSQFNTSTGSQYLADNPDVMEAFQNSGLPQGAYYARDFAESHYQNYGADEGRLSGIDSIDSAIGDSNTIEMPSSASENATDWTDSMLDWSTSVSRSSYDDYANLADSIDGWITNAKNSQRATADQIGTLNNQVSNQMASSGIMGGTEQDYLSAELKAELAKTILSNQQTLDLTGSEMKATAIAGASDNALTSLGSAIDLYSVDAADQANWADLAAELLMYGY